MLQSLAQVALRSLVVFQPNLLPIGRKSIRLLRHVQLKRAVG